MNRSGPALRCLFLCLWIVAAGCAAPVQFSWSPASPGLQVVEGVPFFPQRSSDDCGPAALASLLAHRGVAPDLDHIEANVYDQRLGGSLLADMENYARQQGLEAHSGRGELSLLRELIDQVTPVIILIDRGFGPLRRPHYLVVLGYDQQDRFLVYDGQTAGLFMSAEELRRRWQAMNRLYLYLSREDFG